MKQVYTLMITLTALTGVNQIQAQTYTMNWGSSFPIPWAAGSIVSHTTSLLGGSGVTATVSLTSPEATAMSAFGGFTSPQVSAGGTPFTTQIGSNVSNLALGMNLSSNADYVDLKITFTGAVSNVVFNVSDIDKNSNNSNTYYDKIVVTGAYYGTAVTNPVLTKINGTATNTLTDTVIITGNTAQANTTNGRGGNTAANQKDQNGTVKVNFGIVPLNSITIRYSNAAGAQGNPADQAVGIGNINFQVASVLPVVLTNFTATEKNSSVELDWTTSQEINSADFVIEKSSDGANWQTFTTVAAAGNSSFPSNYSAADAQPYAITYYRLKQVDLEGGYLYSKVIKVAGESNNLSIKIFPNPVTSIATLTTTSKENKTVSIKVYSNGGMLVKEITKQLTTGTNNIDIPSVNTLSNGVYTVVLDNSAVRFIKQ